MNCTSNRITQVKDPFNDWEGNLKKNKSPKPNKKMMCALCVQSAHTLLAPAAGSCMCFLEPHSLRSTKEVLGLTFSKELLKRAMQILSFPFLWDM